MTTQSSNLASKIALDTGSLLTGSLWSRALGMVVGFVTARILGPADYGVMKVVGFVPSLAKYGSFGFDTVAQREVLHLRGVTTTNVAEERHVKNTAFTADLIWVCLLALAVVVVSLFYERPEVRYGLWISALSLVASQVGRLYAVVCSVNKRFVSIAQASVVGSTVQSLFVLTTVHWGRIYSVLGSALLGGLIGIIWYHRQRIHLDFRWSLDRAELLRQFRIAVPLAGGTVALGLFAWVERLQLLHLFGSEQLGIYMLTVTFYDLGLQLVNTMVRASSVHLYERLGYGSDSQASTNLVLKPSLIGAYLLPLAGGLLWLVGPLVFAALLPAYVDVVPLLPWVGAMLTMRSMLAMPTIAMRSARLNMQTPVMLIWLGATGLFAGLTFVGSHLGWGIAGAAMAKTLAFGAVALAAYGLTYPFFFASLRSLLAYFVRVLCPLLVSTAVVWGLNIVWPVNGWAETMLKSLLLVILYAPCLYYLERQTRVFEMVGGPLLRRVCSHIGQKLSKLWYRDSC